MAWEKRSSGRLYYYRSRRVGHRIVKHYLGCGPVAKLAAAMDAEARKTRKAGMKQAREEQSRVRHVSSQVERLSEAADLMTKIALVLAGYHQHHRGEWRHCRG